MAYYFIEGVVIILRGTAVACVLWGLTVFLFRISGKRDVLNERHYLYKEFLFVAYFLVMLRVTGVLGNKWHFGGGLSFNLVPIINEHSILMVLNILLFMPYGFLLPIVFRKMRTWKRVIGSGVLVILAVELIQLLLVGRTFDIDDIIFNSLGVVAGYGAYLQTRRLVCSQMPRNGDPKQIVSASLILGGLAFVIGFPLTGVSVTDIALYQIGINTLAHEYRISSVLPLVIAVAGILIGWKTKDRLSGRIGLLMSVISLAMVLLTIRMWAYP